MAGQWGHYHGGFERNRIEMSKDMMVLNGTIFFDGRFVQKDIRIEDGIIVELAKHGELGCTNRTDREVRVLDVAGKYIIPGLVDVHTHGRNGWDFSKISEDGLEKLLASYGACGVTNVVATTMTNEPSVVESSLEVLGGYMKKQENNSGGSTAKLLGVHMEGPFLGKEKKGAHDENYLCDPDWKLFTRLQDISGGNIRLVTVDPLLGGAEAFIKKCVENGITVSLGHTACDYDTAVNAGNLGVNHVTHTFNAMNPLHHREPGLIGAAMDTGMYMELICDGIHVHPSLVRILFAAHPERVVLISDSIPAAGMPDGEYTSGGLKVMLRSGRAVLEDGTIAGSAISLFDAMVNAIRYGIPAEYAVNSATYLAAESVGMESVAGSIAVGRKADFLVLDKEWNLELVCVY